MTLMEFNLACQRRAERVLVNCDQILSIRAAGWTMDGETVEILLADAPPGRETLIVSGSYEDVKRWMKDKRGIELYE